MLEIIIFTGFIAYYKMNNTKLVDVKPLSDFESKTRLLLYG